MISARSSVEREVLGGSVAALVVVVVTVIVSVLGKIFGYDKDGIPSLLGFE